MPNQTPLGEDAGAFLGAYAEKRWHYAHLARLAAQFLEWKVEDIFSGSPLPVLHLVRHRAKTLESLQRNLLAQRYQRLDNIGDLAGVRIIFYFEDDLERFCNERDRFKTWFGRYAAENLEHKVGSPTSGGDRDSLPGYDSFHFPICVTRGTGFWRSLQQFDKRSASNGGLEGMLCEVQLRTILRHAWAEAEHDLRYKVKRLTDYPLSENTNKTFVQLAVSIEDTDHKLVGIKSEMRNVLKLFSPNPAPTRKSWRYSKSGYKDAFTADGVFYDYQLLHLGIDARNHVELPIVNEFSTVFEIDRVMSKVTGVQRYKHKMWEILRNSEAQFVASIQYDSTVARVCGWDAATRRISLQPARYSDQVVTNHKKALSKPIPDVQDGRTIRDLAFDDSMTLLPFESSPLSNTIGVACMARIDQKFWIGALRSSSVAFDPGMWGCSASGALEWTELGQWDARDFEGWFKGGMAREFEEELGYVPKADAFRYLGFARELGRAGKPQVFFFIDVVDLSSDDFESLWRTYTSPRSEYQKLHFFDTKAARVLAGSDEDEIQRLIGPAGLSEEFRMNLALALHHIDQIG